MEETTWREAAIHNRQAIVELGQLYERFNKRATRILVAIGVVIVISLAFTYSLLRANQARIRDLVNSRYQNCVDQTARHDATIFRLNKIIVQLPASQRKQATASERYTISLIDALAPAHTPQQCHQLAEGRTA